MVKSYSKKSDLRHSRWSFRPLVLFQIYVTELDFDLSLSFDLNFYFGGQKLKIVIAQSFFKLVPLNQSFI